jgi:hypothetical protein
MATNAKAGHFKGRRATLEERRMVHVRQFPDIIDKKTGKPLEYKIDRKIALYILDGADKAERLAASSRENPCVSYTGQSRVWREMRDEPNEV